MQKTPILAATLALAYPSFSRAIECPGAGDQGEGYVAMKIPAPRMAAVDAQVAKAEAALPAPPAGWVLDPRNSNKHGCYEGVKTDLHVNWSLTRCYRDPKGITMRLRDKRAEVAAFQKQYEKSARERAAVMMNPANAVPAQQPQARKEPDAEDMPSDQEMASAGDAMQMAQQIQAAAMAGDMAKVRELQGKMQAMKGQFKKRKPRKEEPAPETPVMKAQQDGMADLQKMQSLAREQQQLQQEYDNNHASSNPNPDWPVCVAVVYGSSSESMPKDAKPAPAQGAAIALKQDFSYFPVAVADFNDVGSEFSSHSIPTWTALLGDKARWKTYDQPDGHVVYESKAGIVKVVLVGNEKSVDDYGKRVNWSALQSIAR